MKKPNLFILGAPKCGTTSLARWLAEHPQVFLPALKEPHHFYSPYHPAMPLVQYERLFSGAGPGHKVIAEASVWYLFSGKSAPRILDYQPDAKFVVCLRNPVEMAISLHAQQVRSGFEVYSSFKEAWQLDGQRRQGRNIGVYGVDGPGSVHLAYQHACSLGSQLRQLLAQVPRERVHLVLLEDLQGATEQVWKNLLEFLEIDVQHRDSFPVHNRASTNRSQKLQRLLMRVASLKRTLGITKATHLFEPLARLNVIKSEYPAQPKSLRMEIYDAFAGEIRLLEEILGRDLSSWNPRNEQR